VSPLLRRSRPALAIAALLLPIALYLSIDSAIVERRLVKVEAEVLQVREVRKTRSRFFGGGTRITYWTTVNYGLGGRAQWAEVPRNQSQNRGDRIDVWADPQDSNRAFPSNQVPGVTGVWLLPLLPLVVAVALELQRLRKPAPGDKL
jgi:hypothetical protein